MSGETIHMEARRRGTEREELSADVMFGAAGELSVGKVIGVVIITDISGLLVGNPSAVVVRLVSEPTRRGRNFAALERFVRERPWEPEPGPVVGG